jgi:iron complex outermembrane receptor protein
MVSSYAHAQTAAAAPAGNSSTPSTSGIQEVVVTAQRREQSLQKVPIAIAAVSGSQLAASGVTNSMALATVVPGLTLTQGRATLQPYLRGIGTQNTGAGDEGTVAIYVDGIYRADATVNAFSLNSVDRVEVLEGPQGTLFGRNSVGGVIQFVTKDPSQRPSLAVEGGYQSYQTEFGSLYGNLPINEHVAANISLSATNQGKGWGTDFTTGQSINFNDEYSVRPKVKFDVGPDTSVILGIDYDRRHSDLGNSRNAYPGQVVIGETGYVGSLYDSVANFSATGSTLTNTDYNMRIKSLLPWSINLGLTTAYNESVAPTYIDLDAGPTSVGAGALTVYNVKTFQQEVLFSGSLDHWVDWTSGAFYFWSQAGQMPETIVGNVGSPANFELNSKMISQSVSGFGQGDFHLGKATLTLGARYTSDTRNIDANEFATAGNPKPVGTLLSTTSSEPYSETHRGWARATYRAALDYQLTDRILGYALVSTGFKSGVFSTSSPFAQAVNPETITDYEVGFKSDFLDRTLRLNVSAFHYDYSNIQLQYVVGTTTLLANAAAAKDDGGEANLTWAPEVPTGHFQLTAGASVMDARYTNFPNAPGFVAKPTGGATQIAVNAAGLQMIKAPRFSSTLSGDYSIDVGHDQELALNVTYSHTGAFYWDPANIYQQGAVDLVNAKLTWKLNDKGVHASIYGTNLTNVVYVGGVVPSTSSLGESPAAPRVVGVSVGYSF